MFLRGSIKTIKRRNVTDLTLRATENSQPEQLVTPVAGLPLLDSDRVCM